MTMLITPDVISPVWKHCSSMRHSSNKETKRNSTFPFKYINHFDTTKYGSGYSRLSLYNPNWVCWLQQRIILSFSMHFTSDKFAISPPQFATIDDVSKQDVTTPVISCPSVFPSAINAAIYSNWRMQLSWINTERDRNYREQTGGWWEKVKFETKTSYLQPNKNMKLWKTGEL